MSLPANQDYIWGNICQLRETLPAHCRSFSSLSYWEIDCIPRDKQGITTSRQQCCEPRSAGKMKSKVPSRSANLLPGVRTHHLIRRHPGRHAYNPPYARSGRSLALQTGGRGEDIPNHCRQLSTPLLDPPSMPGIVDKFPTFLGRSKVETHTRSRFMGGLVLRDSPLGCYSTTIAHTHTHMFVAGGRAAILDYGFGK